MNTENLLPAEVSQPIQMVMQFNELLADYSIFYQNIRGYIWNLKGIHALPFQDLLKNLKEEINQETDNIALRIQSLGQLPMDNLKDYLEIAEIPESHHVTNPQEAIDAIVEAFDIIIDRIKEIIRLAKVVNDNATIGQMQYNLARTERWLTIISGLQS